MSKQQPKFMHVYDSLKTLIDSEFRMEQMLPSENQLCQRFDTSRQTIRSALKLLDRDKLVSNLPGKGWQIHRNGKKRSISQHLGHVLVLGRSDPTCSYRYKGINELAGQHGLSTEFIPFPDNAIELQARTINTQHCDGIIFFQERKASESTLRFIAEHEIPFVQIGHYGHEMHDTICGNYQLSTYEYVQDLYAQGYRNICFTGDKTVHQQLPVGRERQYGYERACADLHIQSKVLLTDWDYFFHKNSESNFIEWLKQDGLPACIIGSMGNALLQIMSIIHRHDLRSPKDIGVAIYGRSEIDDTRGIYPYGKISLLSEPWETLGNIAIQRMLSRINGDTSAASLTLIPLEFVSGDSTQSFN